MTPQELRELDAWIGTNLFGLKIVASDWPCGQDPECGCYEATSHIPVVGSWYTEKDFVYAPYDHGWPP
jgi:hypothetical protein